MARYNKYGIPTTEILVLRMAHKGQIPLHSLRLRTCCTTPPTDTTNGRAHNNSTTNLPHRHVKMLGCGKFLSVGGEFVVQQVVELL